MEPLEQGLVTCPVPPAAHTNSPGWIILFFHKHTRFLILDLQDSAAGALSSSVSLRAELCWD